MKPPRKETSREHTTILNYLWPEVALIIIATLLAAATGIEILTILEMTIITTAQNGTFVLSSRARQSKNLLYHAVTGMIANVLFILIIIASPMRYNTPLFIIWYAICATVAAVHAQYIAIQIEKDSWFRKDVAMTREEIEEAVNRKIENLERKIRELKINMG
ncbi:MAG: hypothetical protein RIQ54_364 [Candidatus Parcubacteria bacterium]|jgi:hypothetical protein